MTAKRKRETRPEKQARTRAELLATAATVFVDGQRVGTTPLSLPDATPGTHRIRLEMTGFSPWMTTANVQAGVRTRVAASLERGTPE